MYSLCDEETSVLYTNTNSVLPVIWTTNTNTRPAKLWAINIWHCQNSVLWTWLQDA